HGAKPGSAGKTAAWQAEAADAGRGLEGSPEAEEGTEGKSEVDAAARADLGRLVDDVPISEHPLPALGRVEDGKRRRGGAAGLAEAGVVLQRLAEIRAVGWMRGLIGDQVRLGGERHAGREFREPREILTQPRSSEPGAIEGILPRGG